MKNWITSSLALAIVATALPLAAAQATKVDNAIWAHGTTYGVIITDTEFASPPEGSTDALYNFMNSGLEGQRAVSASAPGDADYNGGRWSVNLVIFTEKGMAVHDPDGDGVVNFELMSEEAVWHHAGLGHLIIMPTDFYFECPLIPRRQ